MSIDKLRGMARRDDMYIRALDNWISTIRLILLGSGALVEAFAITNLVLILWRSQKKESLPNTSLGSLPAKKCRDLV